MIAEPLDDHILDLLVEWEERREAGRPAPPDELCRACPERVDDLRRAVARIARLDPLLVLAEALPPTLPGFELMGEIGRGGMGVVYKARDLNLDRIVAVKVPGGRHSDPRLLTRFEREAKILAKLRHPGIVPVHAGGVAVGTPYLVMEYIRGGNLSERAAEVANTPKRVAVMVAQVARAVAHAHATGVVHRDLKPSNILLDDLGHPMVSDFGVAALMSGNVVGVREGDTPFDPGLGPTRFTSTGVAAGTPAYSAPELRGSTVSRATVTSDVWSLGVVLYECLTGRLPYPNGFDAAIPPPQPRVVKPGTPRELEAVVLRCLVVDPSNRYRTADDLAADLDRFVKREPVKARPRSWLARRWWILTAHPAGLAAITLTLTMTTMLVVIETRQGSSPPPTFDATPHLVATPLDPKAEQSRIAKLLEGGEEYTFQDNELHTGPFRPLIGGGGALHREADELKLSAVSFELVELLSAAPKGGYELSADIRIDSALPVGGPRAGFYFCFRAGPAGSQPQPWAAFTATFAEGGPDIGNAKANGEAKVLLRLLTCSDREAAYNPSHLGFGPKYRPIGVAGTPGPWRRLGVRVGPSGVIAILGEEGAWVEAPKILDSLCEKQLRQATTLPKWANLPGGFGTDGGIGLCAQQCRVTYRSIRLRPWHG